VLGERLRAKIEVIINMLKGWVYLGVEITLYYWTEDAIVVTPHTPNVPDTYRPCVVLLSDSNPDQESIILTFRPGEMFRREPEDNPTFVHDLPAIVTDQSVVAWTAIDYNQEVSLE